MEIIISQIPVRQFKATFSKHDDEIRLKFSNHTLLSDERKEQVLNLSKAIEEFYLKSDIPFTLRGRFNMNKENYINIVLKHNGRHKKHSILFAEINGKVATVKPIESYVEYLKGKNKINLITI